MLRRTAIATALAVAALTAAGCTARLAPPVATTAETTATQASSAAVDSIALMTAAEKQSKIATSFPLEVPLPKGTVSRGEAQGTTAWDYELVVDAPPAAVAAWYKEYYLARSWELAGEESPESGPLILTLVKNGAQSRVVIEPDGAGKSRASGVLGVGTQVLRTQ